MAIEVEARREITVVLKLGGPDAGWLLGMCQNPPHSDETPADAARRETLFLALRKAIGNVTT